MIILQPDAAPHGKDTRMTDRYIPNTSKALEVILWLCEAKPEIDIYHIVKCAFLADKLHLNRYGRPIAGDNYEAATYGPLGSVVYGLLTRAPFEMIALGGNGDIPLQVDQRSWTVRGTRAPNHARLSDSDVECLKDALLDFGDKDFEELVAITHQDPAYIAARGGLMRPIHLIDDGPDAKEKRESIEETAEHVTF